MALIIHEATRVLGGPTRRSIATPTVLGAISFTILLVAVLAGAAGIGLLLAGAFALGAAFAVLEQRPLTVTTAAALGGLHLLGLIALLA